MAWFSDWFNTPYYHLLYGERDSEEASEFISALIAHLRPSEDSVFLDLACGKGRHAIEIASSGFEVYGVDLSCESIDMARKKAGDRIHFDVHDMREPYRPGSFDYVLNLFTSFGYFEDRSHNLKTLESVVTDLKKCGIFVQDYFNEACVRERIVPFESRVQGGIRFDIRKQIENDTVIKSIDFEDHGHKWHFSEKVSLFGLEDFRRMYAACGLDLLEVFGSYEFEAFDPGSSERLILISAKI